MNLSLQVNISYIDQNLIVQKKQYFSVNGESNHFRMNQFLKVFHDANGDGQIDENDDNESHGF